MDHHVDQVFGAAVLWPFPRDSTTTYLLIGGAYQHTADRWCVAEGEPEPRGRLDFPAGFDCSRDPVDVNIRALVPLYGVGIDSDFESRFFIRVQYRARLVPSLVGQERRAVNRSYATDRGFGVPPGSDNG